MADKKITQFPDFQGIPDSGVFFVVASGDTSDPNSSNYRYTFDSLSTGISQAGSPWKTGSDFVYTTFGKVGVGVSNPEYQFDVAAGTGRFRGDVIISGDLDVSGTTRVHEIIDVTTTGDISGSGLHFASGYFSEALTISGVPVSTGNIDGGEIEAKIATISGNVDTLSGEVDGILTTGLSTKSGIFSEALTISGVPVSTGGGGGTGDSYWKPMDYVGVYSGIYFSGAGAGSFVGIGTDLDNTLTRGSLMVAQQDLAIPQLVLNNTAGEPKFQFNTDPIALKGDRQRFTMWSGTSPGQVETVHLSSMYGSYIAGGLRVGCSYNEDGEGSVTPDLSPYQLLVTGGGSTGRLLAQIGDFTNSLTCAGDVGIGTDNPTGRLHVAGGMAAFDSGVNISGDLRVSGEAYFSPSTIYLGDAGISGTNGIVQANSGAFSDYLTLKGVPVATGIGNGSWFTEDKDSFLTQLGDDFSVSVGESDQRIILDSSEDGSVIVISEGTSTSSVVRVLEYSNETWTEVGVFSGLVNRASHLGTAPVAINRNGTIIAIGEMGWNSDVGRVRVFQRSVGGNAWSQVGSSIEGGSISTGELGAGRAVAMSTAANTISDLAIFLTVLPPSTSNPGYEDPVVRRYIWSGTDWIKPQPDLSSGGEGFGDALSVNGDGTVVAIGKPCETPFCSGKVQVWEVSGANWVQRGVDLYPVYNPPFTTGARFGTSVSISADASIMAVGAPSSTGLSSDESVPKVYVYTWNAGTSSWDLIKLFQYPNESPGMGRRVKLNAEATSSKATLMVGKIGGYAQIHRYENGTWDQIGTDIAFAGVDASGPNFAGHSLNYAGTKACVVQKGYNGTSADSYLIVQMYELPTSGPRYYNLGNVGIGTDNPTGRLHVVGGMAAFDSGVNISGSLGVGIPASGTIGSIVASNDIIQYASSDERLKDNIAPIQNALNKVTQINGVEFDWNETSYAHLNGHDIGVIAQNIEKVLPEVVTTREDGYKAVRYEKIIPLLIEGIKDLQIENDKLKARLDANGL